MKNGEGKKSVFLDTVSAPKKNLNLPSPKIANEKNREIKKFAKEPEPKLLKKELAKPKKAKKKIDKNHKKRHFLRTVVAVVVTIFVLNLIFLSGIAYGYPSFYKDRVMPGVYVLGQEMGGKYDAELKKVIRKNLDDTRIAFQIGGKEESASLYDLGVSIDSSEIAKKAQKLGRTGNFKKDLQFKIYSFAYWLSPNYTNEYLSKEVVPLPYKVETEKVSVFSKNLVEKHKTPERNASVIIKGSDIEVLPAQVGEKIIIDSLEKQISQALGGLKNGNKVIVSLSKEKVLPGIKEEGLVSTVEQTKAITNKKINLVYESKNYAPTKELIASWVTFEENNKTLVPKVDMAKVESYVNSLSSDINVAALPRKIKVENGVNEVVEEEGKEGKILLIAENATNIKSALESPSAESNVNLVVIAEAPKLIRNEVLVADWEKYIDVNLTTQTMTAYLKGGQQVNSWKVTTGKDGTPTPVGTWLVHGKTAVTRMTGGTPGVDYYDLPNVHWITWFKGGGYAFHEAYWRQSFGGGDYTWNGSHGCINLPIDVAQYIYDWAPIGTPVIVHN